MLRPHYGPHAPLIYRLGPATVKKSSVSLLAPTVVGCYVRVSSLEGTPMSSTHAYDPFRFQYLCFRNPFLFRVEASRHIERFAKSTKGVSNPSPALAA